MKGLAGAFKKEMALSLNIVFLKTWLVSLEYLPHDEPDALELCRIQNSHCSRLAQVTSALGLGLCVDTKFTK